MFHEFSTSQHARAPLYAALTAGIARDPELYRLLAHAPPTQRLPVLLLACTHTMVLSEPHQELAEWYPNLTEEHRSPDDPALLPTFKQFVSERAVQLVELIATKRTQTNEVGRCSMLLPALGIIGSECGPIAHLDVGASGGLNLLLDEYQYHYVPEDGGATRIVGEPSMVTLIAHTRGDVPVHETMPEISARLGVDVHPVDITSDTEAHWLEACVWPDQRDRFLRLRAAIEIGRSHPPEIIDGDAISTLDGAIEIMTRSGHPVVTNSWVLNYLTPDERTTYVAELDRIGATTDISWIYSEAPALTRELPWEFTPEDPHLTVTAIATWRSGARTVRSLVTSHPHGAWIHAIN